MRRSVLLVILSTALAAANAAAVPVFYTSRGAWEAAAGAIRNTGFEGLAAAGSSVDYSASGLSLDGIQFDSYGNGPGTSPRYLLVVDSAYVNSGCGYPCYNWGSGAVLHGSPANGFGFGTVAPSGILAAFSGTLAAGSDVWTIFPDQQATGPEVKVIVTAGGTEFTFLLDTPAGGPPNRGFAGFVSADPITAIRFEALGVGTEGGGAGPYLDLDNFAVAVPEPGTLFLLGSGLAAAGLRSRRRSSR